MKKITFLLTDDHPLFRMGVRNLLTLEFQNAVNIFEASNGREALDIIEKHNIQCLIIDINMSEMQQIDMDTCPKNTTALSL